MTVLDFSPDPSDEIANLKAQMQGILDGVEILKAQHDSQRRDLQRRNSELVERARHAERIVSLLHPATHMHGYFISSPAILALPRETREYFEMVLKDR
jgi:hypothetical protein